MQKNKSRLSQSKYSIAKTVLSATAVVTALSFSVTSADEEGPIAAVEAKLGRPVEFERDIYPMLQANCVACHNKAKSEGDLNLETSQSIMKGGSSGLLVVPGKPDESLLYKVASRTEESFMPPWPNEVQARKLTPEQVGLLRQWILEGAKAGAAASAANMQWQSINNTLRAVYSVDTDPFGRFVAAGRAGNVDIYDLLVRDNVAKLVDPALAELKSESQTAHRDYVHSMAFHPHGQMLVTSGFQVVKLWERDVASLTTKVDLPAKAVRIVSSADGTILAIQCDNKTIVTRNQQSHALTTELSDVDPAATTLLAIGGPENTRLVTSGADGIVKLFDLTTDVEIAASDALEIKATQAALTADGIKVTVLLEDGSLRLLTVNVAEKKITAADPVKSDKGVIQQITAAGTMLLCRMEGTAVELRNLDSLQVGVQINSATPNVTAMITQNAERVVTISPDGIVELWNAKDGKIVATLNSDLQASRTLAERVADKAVRDARVGVVKAQVTEDEKRVTEQQDSLKKAEEELAKAKEAVAAAKKKAEEEAPKVVAAKKASEEKADDAALKKALEGAEKAQMVLTDAVTTAENALKSAEKGKELSIQAIARAEAKVVERKALQASAEQEATVSAEAHTAADAASKVTIASQHATFVGNDLVATVEKANVRLWKASDGTAVDLFSGVLPEAATTAMLSSARAFVVQREDGQLFAVSAFPDWKLKRTLGPQPDNKPSLFVDRVLALAFSPDGSTLATGGGEASRSGELMLWNVADGNLIRNFEDAHSDTVYGIDFSADGKLLASAAADKFVKVFDLSTGMHVRSYEGHTHHVMDVSWKGDGTSLISAGADNAIKVWNAETGEQFRTISTYTKQVTSLSFIGMEDDFISCSGDKRVFRHKAANGGTVREFKGCSDYVYCSATTADGAIVAAGCEDGILRIWNGQDAKEIATFAP